MRRWLLALVLLLSLPARAQEPAALIADRVVVEPGEVLVATGAVEVLYGETRLRARRIAYDGSTGALTIDGPITLVEGDRILVLADAAQLDGDLRNGILTSARVMLDQQLQLAATQVRRVDGRYAELTNTVASSCQVCANNPVALWSIRARRVVHDQQERQLYFENATFRVLDVPVLWLPRLRLPDPSLERATGFLIPSIRTTSRLGTGIKVPYFVALGPSRDLTVTPYLSPDTRTLELRYRQALRYGNLSFSGAVSRDDLRPGETRAYLFGEGVFQLPRDFRLGFGIELVSDPAYLLDYDYSEADRLETFLGLERVRRDEVFSARITNFRTLRESEMPIADQLPHLVGAVDYERRLPDIAGGEARLGFSMQGHERTSSADILGRDVLRAGLAASWQRSWIMRPGIEALVEARMEADSYLIAEDSTFDGHQNVITPALGATFRWPFERAGRGGARQVLEPMVQLVWSESWGGPVPNEDSTLVEFDEGNLLALDRFPGHDRAEQGFRAALGLGWTRYDPRGWSMGATVGRVFRSEPADFTAASGLEGTASAWLAALHLRGAGGFGLTSRTVLDEDLKATKSEMRLSYAGPRLSLGASYVWVVAEPAEGRPERTDELTVDSTFAFTRHWSGSAAVRYDFEAKRAQSAGVGLGYRNECLAVDLSLSRRFTSSTSLTPTTDVGLTVSLNGFGTDGRDYRRTCPG